MLYQKRIRQETLDGLFPGRLGDSSGCFDGGYLTSLAGRGVDCAKVSTNGSIPQSSNSPGK